MVDSCCGRNKVHLDVDTFLVFLVVCVCVCGNHHVCVLCIGYCWQYID